LGNELQIKINYEITQIDKLINDCQPLIDICKVKTPDFVEMSAAAMVLHSFYNGIENIIIMINKNYNEKLPNSNKWHTELLDHAFTVNGSRKAIFDKELKITLDEYLKFRHFVRHVYGYKLKWPMMENLFFNLKANWEKIRENIIRNTKSEC
jgi:hypothetical protein